MQKANERGLTLTEILVSIGVLTIAFSSFIGVLRSSKSRMKMANQIYSVLKLGQEKIEELKNTAYADLNDGTYSDTVFVPHLTNNQIVTRTWTITTIDDNFIPGENNYKRITLEVRWNEGHRTFTRQIVTQIPPP
ncbi:MAG: type II secretion system GspH family protein [Candidatus Omnitrophica bacterium]|nr:type II secretion system GspH family protein [Candidatus Omnitrophota bacterium]